VVKSEAQFRLDAFLNSVEKAPNRLLMLDYDGTLAPFRKDRDRAFPFPDVAAVVQGIVRGTHTRVVIISGRGITDVTSLLGIQPTPEVWGVYGFERRRPNHTLETAPIEARYLDALSDAGRWIEYQQLGRLAEIKTGSVAVHWRGQSDSEAEQIRLRALLGWRPIAETAGLNILEFDGGLEIRAPGCDKGDVVRNLLQEEGPDVPAAYLGDDATDEPAFRAIRDRGMGILVSPRHRQSAARLWLQPPEEVFDFLTQWLEACRRGDARTDAMAGAGSAS